MSFNTRVEQPTVQGFITLYELDATKLGGDVYRFHGHNNGVITWQGREYEPISITSEGLEVRSDGRASMPKLTIHNDIGDVPQALRLLCLRYDDFAGAKLKVIHTLAEYLDSTDDSNYRVQHWQIEQKTAQNHSTTEFELSNPRDFEGAKLPLRQITNYCHWAVCGRYRGEECGYMGAARFTIDGKPTDDPTKDECGGTIADCILHHGKNSELPFGGFPASGLL